MPEETEEEERIRPKFRRQEIALMVAVVVGVAAWLGWRWYQSSTPEAQTKAACRMSIQDGEYGLALDNAKADPTVRRAIATTNEAGSRLSYQDEKRRSAETYGSPSERAYDDFLAASVRFDETLKGLRQACKPFEPWW